MSAEQLLPFDHTPLEPPVVPGADRGADFAGADYQAERDKARLTGQLRKIYDLMSDGEWRTLREIHLATHEPEASISAQLRHLRKKQFGSHTVNKEHIGNGLYKYQLIVNREVL